MINVPKIATASNPTDSFANCPSDLPNFPIAFPPLEHTQQQDDAIQTTTHCSDQVFCNHPPKVHEKNDGSSKMVLPGALVDVTIKWHHHTSEHAVAS